MGTVIFQKTNLFTHFIFLYIALNDYFGTQF